MTDDPLTPPQQDKLERINELLTPSTRDRHQVLHDHLDDMAEDEKKGALDALRADPDLRTVTLDELAQEYDLSKKTLLRDLHTGKLEAVSLGGRYRVTLAQVRAWLERRTFTRKAQ